MASASAILPLVPVLVAWWQLDHRPISAIVTVEALADSAPRELEEWGIVETACTLAQEADDSYTFRCREERWVVVHSFLSIFRYGDWSIRGTPFIIPDLGLSSAEGLVVVGATLALPSLVLGWVGLRRMSRSVSWIPGYRVSRTARLVGSSAVAMVLFASLWSRFLERLGVDEPYSGLMGLLPREPRWVLLTMLLTVVLAPICEELFFRGYLLEQLEELTTRRVANWLQASFFVSAHLTPMVVPVHLVAGLVCGWVKQQTGSLKASMALHALYNLVAIALLWLG